MEARQITLEKVLQLARAVREEAQTADYDPRFLIMQLATAVEQLAEALLTPISPSPVSDSKELSSQT